jgi:hypothetical protein
MPNWEETFPDDGSFQNVDSKSNSKNEQRPK